MAKKQSSFQDYINDFDINTTTHTGQENLAYKMAPRSIDEYVGQEDLMSEGAPLRMMLEHEQLHSLILYGPPGCGKTCLAKLIAKYSNAVFKQLNAGLDGLAQLKEIIDEANNPFIRQNKNFILFIDEIHRFNKLQQDSLLPHVENNSIILIGATTENPYFSINKALLSRCSVFCLHSLSEKNLDLLIDRALKDKERGWGEYKFTISDEAKAYLIAKANGDARFTLNLLDLALKLSMSGATADDRIINLSIISQILQSKIKHFDKNGDEHYKVISAYIKSVRGSDPDAAIYYLARALSAGEDPLYLARRLVILAAEDIGLANPQVLPVCQSVFEICKEIGMPEAAIPLAEATILLASSPKSNTAYKAIKEALSFVENFPACDIPLYLCNVSVEKDQINSQIKDACRYLYPHDYDGAYVKQDYLPSALQSKTFYHPKTQGFEKKIIEYLQDKHSESLKDSSD